MTIIKSYIVTNAAASQSGGGGGTWGTITGTLSNQTDLQTALNLKEDVANKENTTLDTSTTKYPTNNLVKTSIDAAFQPALKLFIQQNFI